MSKKSARKSKSNSSSYQTYCKKNSEVVEDERYTEKDIDRTLLKDRTILFFCEIDEETIEDLIKKIMYLDAINKKEIKIVINSPGGCVDSFFAYYDIIRKIKSPICTYAVGEACSGGALMLMTGAKGRRFAAKNATIMLHELSTSMRYNKLTDLELRTKYFREVEDRLENLMVKHMGIKKSDCVKFRRDSFMNTKEALKLGIIDKIL